ncbi:putative branched-chain amino acid aminotransferase [Monocercomonoides exilis]|uniref:putative branched-chain amino acid aminotransferase n=1 Tax=Monocercomonoides exilis TaxID=2049356 RepID=UPI0035598799|nr:putative branched-chain amino acid aminotransferase [Monocercomonoides exilis]|eukprot:MONOS_11043.1-p1 / transcript=MONOS_11043.1 / gene=MONOS_11043 / organism=Monocercomonoides_exilis_PA203 / gene_product=unspecified product / transcript_product=unspecified product / location=Mono_scaffold00531:30090-31160(+) / protein_length=357 / sequence_SO=supercontig / SO=protein_coding / is_pseudo=false
MEIIKELVPESERKPVIEDCLKVKFGHVFTDHMFVQEYKDGKWQNGVIKKVDNLSLHPGALVLHYGQEIFEGAKCFKTASGKFAMFRIKDNIARMNRSAAKLEMPQMDPEYAERAIKELIKVDERHIPTQEGCSLYIRPFMIATEPGLGVRPSSNFIFCVLLCPVGAYYPEGFKPAKIYSTDKYSRSAPRGTGDIKCGGNYAASLAGGEEAHKHGCSQMLWLDSRTHKYVEEVGSMNVFFVKEGTVYTAPLAGTILPGITRASVITLCKDNDIPVKEEALEIDELCKDIEAGRVTEIFGSGTAASICPVSELVYKEGRYVVSEGKIGPVTQKMYDLIIGIQRGNVEDKYGWLTYLD